MAMYHANHPNGDYEMANRVEVFDPPRSISWKPGHDPGDGKVRFGGWIWRYDLAPLGTAETDVTRSYDWSGVPEALRQEGEFPPFAPDHLGDSLTRPARLAVAGAAVPHATDHRGGPAARAWIS